MSSLTDVYQDISARDAAYLEKHAAQIKQAEEEDAAGRIMARGFADEIHKLAMGMNGMQYGGGAPEVKMPAPPKMGGGPAQTIKSPGYSTGGGATGPSATATRTPKAPKAPKLQSGTLGQGSQVKQTTGQIVPK